MATIAEMAREERIENITTEIVEAALCEAIRNDVGCSYIIEALNRAAIEIMSINVWRRNGSRGIDRMNELRKALGMPMIPTAKATEKTDDRPVQLECARSIPSEGRDVQAAT